MKATVETDKRKIPGVVIDPELNKYDNVVLFPEKLAKAKEHLKRLAYQNFQRRSTAANKYSTAVNVVCLNYLLQEIIQAFSIVAV